MMKRSEPLCQLRVAVEVNARAWENTVKMTSFGDFAVIRLAAAATRSNILVQKLLSSRRTISTPNFHIHRCI
jgi:hypothetical protein